jgi:uncharacterized protein YqgC (DUF456 family)
MVVNIILLVLGIACLLGGIFFAIKPLAPNALIGFAGICLLHWSKYINVSTSAFIFWGIASVLVLLVDFLRNDDAASASMTGNIYATVGAVGGMLLGMALGAAFMVLGVIVGALVGVFAFSKTPNGAGLKFPTSTFIHYFCAVGFPVIVTVAMAGLAVEGFIVN